ncbi:MAG: hypothetical protein ACI97B_003537 [Verrucomicrobiales bacterium]|jgi:hypothetical protein
MYHILLQVPEREALDDAEIIRRLEIASGKDAATSYWEMIDRFLARVKECKKNVHRVKVK